LYKSKSKKQEYHITIDSESSPPMHPTPFSEVILEYEFHQKFMILIFDCYSSQSDQSNVSASIRTRWWSMQKKTPFYVRSFSL